jgi:uridine kinase
VTGGDPVCLADRDTGLLAAATLRGAQALGDGDGRFSASRDNAGVFGAERSFEAFFRSEYASGLWAVATAWMSVVLVGGAGADSWQARCPRRASAMTYQRQTLPRREAVVRLAHRIADRRLGHPTRVAVDGVTASGKSTLARELAAAVSQLGRPVIHVSMDGFHHPRARRHHQGRESASGYYEDAYDFAALARELLKPLGPTGDRQYRTSVINLGTDTATAEPAQTAPQDAVLVVDGTFLQRPEIRDLWDERVWVNTPLQIACQRGIDRDADLLGGSAAAERLFAKRYHAAAQIYIDAVAPAQRATVVFGNQDREHAQLQFAAANP